MSRSSKMLRASRAATPNRLRSSRWMHSSLASSRGGSYNRRYTLRLSRLSHLLLYTMTSS